jgi:hypothetical protein
MCCFALVSVCAFLFLQVNLVEWLKKMVSNRDYEAVLDPKLPEKPSSKALKKALLVALRCVDPDSQKRPKMGHAIHMLEVDDFPYRDVSFFASLSSQSQRSFAHRYPSQFQVTYGGIHAIAGLPSRRKTCAPTNLYKCLVLSWSLLLSSEKWTNQVHQA